MLRINLLPVKAARKHVTAKQELVAVATFLSVVAVILYMWHQSIAGKVEDMQGRVNEVRGEIKQLKQDVVKVEDFKKKAETLENKIQVIHDLQTKRIGPAKLLDELATILNEEPKVWLTKFEEGDEGKLVLEGGAMEHENISDFQLALDRHSTYLKNLKLVLVVVERGDRFRTLKWRMTCNSNYTSG